MLLECRLDISPLIKIHQWLPKEFKIKTKFISLENKTPWTLPYFSSFYHTYPLFWLFLGYSFLFCALVPTYNTHTSFTTIAILLDVQGYLLWEGLLLPSTKSGDLDPYLVLVSITAVERMLGGFRKLFKAALLGTYKTTVEH